MPTDHVLSVPTAMKGFRARDRTMLYLFKSRFFFQHPGGEEVLLEKGGQDATEPFEDVSHSSDARSLMKKYKIGELVEADRVQSKNAFAPQWSNDQPQEQGKCVIA
uniref:Cytochrome b5 n=1 Tax=Heliothis virescens TaxID=7102 RepID=A0A2A4JVD9_HELVI